MMADRCGSVVVRVSCRDIRIQGLRGSARGPGLTLGCYFLFFSIETLLMASQKNSKCLKRGSDRLRNGQMPVVEIA